MAGNAERSEIEQPEINSPSTSRRWFLRAAAMTATSLVVGACSKRSQSAKQGAAEAAAEPVQPDAIPGPPKAEPIVRVRLRSVAPPAEPIEIGPAHQWLRISAPEDEKTLAVLRGPLQLTRADSAWSLVDERGFATSLTDEGAIGIGLLRDAQPVMLVGGQAFPGILRVHTRLDRHADAFDLVSHVPMESYLPGVLVRELYNHWHLETHTAQAIAARSFASTESVLWSTRRHFDVTNTEASQMYVGLTTHETSLEAVRSTRGVVLTYGDQLVPGYYSSSCGGCAATALDAIGPNPINDVPPLMGRVGEDACASLDQVHWKVTHVISALAQRMQAFGKAYSEPALADIGTLRDIEASETNAHGRPTRFVITTEGGSRLEILAEQLRRAANFADASDSPRDRLLSSFVDPQAGAARITFNGQGRGHGAGLCQYGAEMQARNGVRAMEILSRYYPGVEIITSYT